MLKSYVAVYEKGYLRWLNDEPEIDSARILVTILEETPDIKKRRVPPLSIAGKAKVLGDIINPIADDEDWECLK